MIKQNEGGIDRFVRLLASIGLATVSYFYLSGVAQAVLYVIAGILLFTAITGFCGLYKILGINTCKIKR